MEMPVLFILTPRAGRWNHRYLVPSRAPWSRSEEQLGQWARWAAEREDGTDYVSVCREVSQAGDGRIGTEWLILRDARLASPARKQHVKDELRHYLDELETLVTGGIDWNRTGEKLVVSCPELDRWQRDFERLLSQSWPIPDEHTLARSAENPVRHALTLLAGASGIWPFKSSRAFLLAALAVMTMVYFLARNDGGSDPDPALVNATGQDENSSPAGRRDAAVNRRHLDPLADAIGLSTVSLPDGQVMKRLADTLEADLFDWESEQSVGSSDLHEATDADAPNSGERFADAQRLKRTLNAFYKAVFNKPERRSLSELVEDDGLLEELSTLYPFSKQDRQDFDSTGYLAHQVKKDGSRSNGQKLLTEELRKDLRDLDPIELRKIGHAVHEFWNVLNKDEDLRTPGSDDKFLQFFYHVYRIYKDDAVGRETGNGAPNNGPLPKFYLQDDLSQAGHLLNLLGHESVRELLLDDDESSNDFSEASEWPSTLKDRLGALQARRSNSLLSDESLKNAQKRYSGGPKRDAFKRLEKFIRLCCKAAEDRAHPSLHSSGFLDDE
jgi:hypothetical protein